MQSPNTYYVGDDVFVQVGASKWRGTIKSIVGDKIAVAVPDWNPLVETTWDKIYRPTEVDV